MQVKLPDRVIKHSFYGFMTGIKRIFAKKLYSDPDKPEITNYKHHLILKLGQINSKSQYPNLK